MHGHELVVLILKWLGLAPYSHNDRFTEQSCLRFLYAVNTLSRHKHIGDRTASPLVLTICAIQIRCQNKSMSIVDFGLKIHYFGDLRKTQRGLRELAL